MSILFPAGADADVGHAAARPMPQSGWSWLVLRLVRYAPYWGTAQRASSPTDREERPCWSVCRRYVAVPY